MHDVRYRPKPKGKKLRKFLTQNIKKMGVSWNNEINTFIDREGYKLWRDPQEASYVKGDSKNPGIRGNEENLTFSGSSPMVENSNWVLGMLRAE